MSQFRAFGGIIWQILEHYVTFCNFLHYMCLLGHLRCFVANSICRNLRTFSDKLVLAETLFVLKKLSFCISDIEKLQF